MSHLTSQQKTRSSEQIYDLGFWLEEKNRKKYFWPVHFLRLFVAKCTRVHVNVTPCAVERSPSSLRMQALSLAGMKQYLPAYQTWGKLLRNSVHFISRTSRDEDARAIDHRETSWMFPLMPRPGRLTTNLPNFKRRWGRVKSDGTRGFQMGFDLSRSILSPFISCLTSVCAGCAERLRTLAWPGSLAPREKKRRERSAEC